MDDGPESLVLRYLRNIDGKVDRLFEEVVDVKRRLQTVELSVADLCRDLVRVDHRLDSIDERLGRVERRLDLREAAEA